MTIKEQIKFWIDSAESDLTASENLFVSGNYDWCLFIGHLILEKALKALYIQNKEEMPPRIHDLVKLAQYAGIKLEKEQDKFYAIVNTFNIEARYSEYKSDFHKICTKDFTNDNFTKIKEQFLWLKSLLK
jgi:HEPN domain-containing protein